MEILAAYGGPALALIGALLGLTVDKDGKWTIPKGWKWLFLIMALIGFGLAVWKVSDTLRKSAAAQREVQAARNREAAGQRAMLGGFDFSRPFQAGSFYFDVPANELGEAAPVSGFNGPFPALGVDASALLVINVRDGFYYEYQLRPTQAGLELIDASGQNPVYILRPGPNGPDLVPAGTDAGHRATSRYADDGELRPGEWNASADAAELSYHLGIASPEPLRSIVSGLSTSARYGRLTLRVPNISEARRREIVSGYRRIRPSFVFYAPLAAGNPRAEDCVTRIRVPMEMRRADSADPDELVFDLAAAPTGFDTETCNTAYVP